MRRKFNLTHACSNFCELGAPYITVL